MRNVGVGAGDNADSNDPKADPTTAGPGKLSGGNVGVGAGDNADSNDPRADPTTSGPGMLIEGIGGDDGAASRGFRFSMTGGPVRMISRVADGAGAGSRGFKIFSRETLGLTQRPRGQGC